jgi:putative endonuclease
MERRMRLGREGEQVAAAYVAHLGWTVLARNWRPAEPALRGELDIVAVDAGDLVVCEVKTRRGTGAGAPLEAVTTRKLQQLRRLAAAWLAEHAGAGHDAVRIDVIGLLWPHPAVKPTVEHRRDVGR